MPRRIPNKLKNIKRYMHRLEQILLGVTSCVLYERISFVFESKREEYAEINRLTLSYEAQLGILRKKSQKDNLLIDQLFSKLQESKLKEDILSNEFRKSNV